VVRDTWKLDDNDDAIGDLIRLVASGVVDLNKVSIHGVSLAKINEAV